MTPSAGIDPIRRHPHPPASFRDGKCALSIPLSPGRPHEIRIVSETGALAPKETGLSADARPLSYRVRVLSLTDAALFESR